jgi:hypothetical protein
MNYTADTGALAGVPISAIIFTQVLAHPLLDGASESATSIAARAGSTNINLNASAGLLRRNLLFKLLQASQQAIEFLRELGKYLVGLIGGGIGPLQVPL